MNMLEGYYAASIGIHTISRCVLLVDLHHNYLWCQWDSTGRKLQIKLISFRQQGCSIHQPRINPAYLKLFGNFKLTNHHFGPGSCSDPAEDAAGYRQPQLGAIPGRPGTMPKADDDRTYTSAVLRHRGHCDPRHL